MSQTGLEEGQKVRIDVESIMQDDKYTVGRNWHDREYIIGTVEGQSEFNLQFYEVSIRPEDNNKTDSPEPIYTADVEKKYMEPYRVCESCEGEEIYHDGQEEWLCPFCDME